MWSIIDQVRFSVCVPWVRSAERFFRKHTANSSIITKSAVPFSEPGTDISVPTKLLSHHLTNSPIQLDAEGIPFANPSSDLSFGTFASLFPPTDQSFAARLFRLGDALFDDIDLRLDDSVSIDVRNRVHAVRRKEALSKWPASSFRHLKQPRKLCQFDVR